jgi:hypothetical protein
VSGSTFTTALKTAATYIDVAANSNGAEKAHLALQALKRMPRADVHLVEVGPGGGSAVAYLASQLCTEQPPVEGVRLTLVEVPGVTSASLTASMDAFNRVGTCRLLTGFAQDIGTLLPEPVDVISASALLHEVYSYGGGYAGLHSMIRTLPTVLKPSGMFAYRDVYAVKAGSLHDRTQQTYTARAWLRFLRMFLPQYLDEGTHPYHGAADQVVLRQNSQIVTPEQLSERTSVVAEGPVGIFREVQRHYITLRDHIWRSGMLGFSPYLEGPLSGDWIDARQGHKRVHYRLTDSDWLPASQKTMLLALSEPYMDHHTVDGDIFDECTDIALTAFLARAEEDADECADVWRSWVTREGRETYAYMTLDSLLAAVAVHSSEAAQEQRTVLMPVRPTDVMRRDRAYYNRYLRRALPNPLKDAKQMVLFSNIPVTDSESLSEGLHCLQQWCSKSSLARVYAAVNQEGG